jgi:hypothetical protein
MYSLDWISVTIGYIVGIMMYHSIAFLIVPNNRK